MNEMPAMDEQQFAEDNSRIDRQMTEALREPRRAVAVAADEFRNYPRFDEELLSSFRINEYDQMDFREDLQDKEEKLASRYRTSALDPATYRKCHKALAGKALSTMQPRAHLRDALFVFAFSLVSMGLASLPFIFGLAGGAGWNSGSLIISLVATAVLSIVGLIPIKLSHFKLRRNLKRYSEVIQRLLADSRQHAEELGDRISEIGSCRKGYTLLNRQNDDTKPYTSALVALHKMKGEIEDVLGYYSNEFDASPANTDSAVAKREEFEGFASWGEAKEALETPGFFEIFPSKPYDSCPLNAASGSCDQVQRPYPFIMGMTLERIALYDSPNGLETDDDSEGLVLYGNPSNDWPNLAVTIPPTHPAVPASTLPTGGEGAS